ncbi:solute carrier family 25 member 44 isoform X1 [Balaenoptera ricei]|uniref:solute carrier family 25 member 44 isoform X1 n=2 Tax=Balaenoptera ricei TaxID=2746895 RepID=UPI0028BE7CEC|nr:solute carrier family 25 member 44 isoform X1 [Balaenoptera ricei]XP_059789761.1 solute carrier family 25 member 44 isoform X1 [Balaenoptera ricei]
MEDKRNIQIIEWEHLDKKKFYVFGVAMTMMIRVSVYPFTLIRTRLQVQKGKSLYHGTFDAFIKILRADGVTGLYRGFLVNTFTLISGQCYVTTYELTRKFVADYSQSNTVKSLVAGGSASLVAQSITVPIDVVSQHLMMQRKGEKTGRFQVRGNPEGQGVVAFGQTKDIIRQILRADGLRGFYRGYVASLLTYIPNSAVWWPFYHFYAEQLSSLCPKECPHIVFQAISGPLAAATASILTNPMDVIRTRVQGAVCQLCLNETRRKEKKPKCPSIDEWIKKICYQRFTDCYKCFYQLQPEMTQRIYDKFVTQLQTSIQEEISEIKAEGNLEAVLNALDAIVEESKDCKEPAWRPSGIPEKDLRSAVVPYFLQQRDALQRRVQKQEAENRQLADAVLAGRRQVEELQLQGQARQQAWQALHREQKELVAVLREPE